MGLRLKERFCVECEHKDRCYDRFAMAEDANEASKILDRERKRR